MREILSLHLGQCGNQIGSNFWQTISPEHGVALDGTYQGESDLQLQKINIYYNQSNNSRYVPRALFVDLEPGTTDSIQASPIGRLVGPDSFISGQKSAGNIWPKGMYTDGAEMIDEILDAVRREIEKCDSFEGIQLTHAIGGGTGSGLGSLFLGRFFEDHYNRIGQIFSVTPSTKVSDIILEPYNAVLTFSSLVDHSETLVHFIDNEALFNICSRNININKPTYNNMNNLISCVMSDATASMRFPGQLNSNLGKMFTNLVPFPRTRFFIQSYAPLNFNTSSQYKSPTVPDLVQQLFNPKNLMCDVDPRSGRYLTGSVLFRGKLQTSEAEETLFVYKQNNSNFVEWIPDSFHTSYCDIPPTHSTLTATMIFHSTVITKMLRKFVDQFTVMFRRKAFLHWYLNEGMDEMEFTEAESIINDTISEYECSNSYEHYDESEEFDLEEQ